MLIHETGTSSEFELTPLRFGLCAALLAGIIVVSAGALSWSIGISKNPGNAQLEALSLKVKSLEEELQKKELALAIQEKKLKESQEAPTLAAASKLGADTTPVKTQDPKTEDSRDSNPLTTFNAALKTPSENVGEEEQDEVDTGVQPRPGPSRVAESMKSEPKSSFERGPTTPMIMNFDAQNVTALSQTAQSGTLSFRLIKDQPDIMFSGYLFVFVEMTDRRGENKIYAYPKKARLGEEDLPVDFRDGESIAFKRNSKVELPYEDIRAGASLSRVSILLYGENGRILFQRGFDRKELKSASHRGTVSSHETRPRTAERRRAL
ncbi:hypothetical protein [Desulfomonile tiedjei]|uniref:Uncharacterized protein n=1 Tax=Desulfomonile tiedjei (strain ATCC 49306 / DSM 6799 / DCB-1) TaxID=706587 RepID=I4C3M2_DESTA|nr:hypothetical protein [Desulfomonile tiedjei]AFM24163.1 hypothetical protein Desti_1451 [Desulfomonile tiedjei DSM 6799]